MYMYIYTYTRSLQARFLHFHLNPSPLFAGAVRALHFTVLFKGLPPGTGLGPGPRSARPPACQVGRGASLPPQDPQARHLPCSPGPRLSRQAEVLPRRHLHPAPPAGSHGRLMGLLGAREQAGSGRSWKCQKHAAAGELVRHLLGGQEVRGRAGAPPESCCILGGICQRFPFPYRLQAGQKQLGTKAPLGPADISVHL